MHSNLFTLTALAYVLAHIRESLTRTKSGKYTKKNRIHQTFSLNF